MSNLRVIKEDLRGCINKGDAPDFRFYVIDTPINETGICQEFDTEEKAITFIKSRNAVNR